MMKMKRGTKRKSDMLRMLNSFSKYTNIKETTIDLTGVSSESDEVDIEDVSLDRNKSKRVKKNQSGSVDKRKSNGFKRKQSGGGESDNSMLSGKETTVRN